MSFTETSSRNVYHKPFYEIRYFQFTLAILVVLAVILSGAAWYNTYQLKKLLVPKTINTNDFLKKLTAHSEMQSFAGTPPINIVQINNNNFGNLQTQISGLDISHIGSFIVQFKDRIVVYDYENDKIKGTVGSQQPQLPSDLLTKLNKHPEMADLQNEQPIGGKLDTTSLNSLKQEYPNEYSKAKVGDYLLRYQKKLKLIIYDYDQDKIVNLVKLT